MAAPDLCSPTGASRHSGQDPPLVRPPLVSMSCRIKPVRPCPCQAPGLRASPCFLPFATFGLSLLTSLLFLGYARSTPASELVNSDAFQTPSLGLWLSLQSFTQMSPFSDMFFPDHPISKCVYVHALTDVHTQTGSPCLLPLLVVKSAHSPPPRAGSAVCSMIPCVLITKEQ